MTCDLISWIFDTSAAEHSWVKHRLGIRGAVPLCIGWFFIHLTKENRCHLIKYGKFCIQVKTIKLISNNFVQKTILHGHLEQTWINDKSWMMSGWCLKGVWMVSGWCLKVVLALFVYWLKDVCCDCAACHSAMRRMSNTSRTNDWMMSAWCVSVIFHCSALFCIVPYCSVKFCDLCLQMH